MKKLLGWILVLVLMFGCSNALCETAEDSDIIDFACDITDAVFDPDMYGTSIGRAMITVMLCMDLMYSDLIDEEIGALNMLLYPTFIGKDDETGIIVITGMYDGYVISIFYSADLSRASFMLDEAEFTKDESVAREFMETVMTEGCSSYYENDASEIEFVVTTVAEALS